MTNEESILNNPDIEDYFVIYIGKGEFKVKMPDGEIKEAGPNLRGMIRYTYFEDYTLPDVGWHTTRKKLIQDHWAKLSKEPVENLKKMIKNE